MAMDKSYIDYVCEQLSGENSRYKKMFGEYMLYIEDKPVLLVCDNTVFVKKFEEIKDLMLDADCGFPYEGAKEHYVLDIDNADLTEKVVQILKQVVLVPKKKAR